MKKLMMTYYKGSLVFPSEDVYEKTNGDLL